MAIEALIDLIEKLRGENGCPWDRKQTPRTMSVYLIEEMYELVDAIASGTPDEVREELGDVLFHILFIARMFQERGDFSIEDVVRTNTAKMIRRHPHVFGNDKVSSTEEVKQRWHKIKMAEKRHAPKDSILDTVPQRLPALMRAYRISERAARAGFDWDDFAGVMQKTQEEWDELQFELAAQGPVEENQKRVALEFGDVLFTLVNVARFAEIHPETALTDSIKKFEKRFRHMEKIISVREKDIASVSRNEWDILWQEAKEKAG